MPLPTKSWIDHLILQIVKGVPKVPGDTNSIESNLQTINLVSDKTGISLVEWEPGYPTLENNGVWADSPLQVGRKPLVMVDGNVVETMRLTVNANSIKDMMHIQQQFSFMRQAVMDFWTANYQIDPVYLHWYASCGAGPQYALIYNMDYKFTPNDSPSPSASVSLSLEREPYWRWIAPGANPMQWTNEFNNQPYIASTVLSTNILGGNSLLFSSGVLTTRSELNAGATALVTDNCLVIPASLVPGDVPALLEFKLQGSSSYPNLVIGKKTIKLSQHSAFAANLGVEIVQNGIMNCNDGTLGTNASLANDTGASKAIGAGTAQRVEISFGTATNALRWRSQYSNANSNNLSNMNRFIGRWMVFLRCRQSSGSVGDVTMYLRYGTAVLADTDGVKMNIVNPPVPAGGTGNSTDWGLVYMGIVTIPFHTAKADVNAGGNQPTVGNKPSDGLNNQLYFSGGGTLEFGLFAARTAGAGLLYLNDLVLIPVDEGSVSLEYADTTASALMMFDETGYLNHGLSDPFVSNGGTDANYGLAKFTGTGIQLSPGVENRLYIMAYNATQLSNTNVSFTYAVNIVPRSRGIRDRSNIYG
jgi:hypothetical protein